MKYKKLLFSALILTYLSVGGLMAQQSINASGGNASGSGGSATFSVGQLFYHTHTASSGSVAQGIQQPYEISVVTEIPELIDLQLLFTAYPNPMDEALTLSWQNYTAEDTPLIYQLLDAGGKIMLSGKIISSETLIKTGNLAPAIYFLKVTQNNQALKVFKILKK